MTTELEETATETIRRSFEIVLLNGRKKVHSITGVVHSKNGEDIFFGVETTEDGTEIRILESDKDLLDYFRQAEKMGQERYGQNYSITLTTKPY